MKKDTSIEGIRIISCVLVILAHVQLDPVLNGTVMNSRLLYTAVMADSVPLFFLITGFFLFRGVKDDESIIPVAKKKAKSVLVNIWIPSFIIMAMSCFLFPYLSGQCSLGEIFTQHYDRQWDWLWDYVFKLRAEGTGEHLWYICTYVKVIIWFPALAFLCQNTEKRNMVRRFYLILSLVNVAFNDLEYLLNRDICDMSGITFDYYFLYILLGYELSVLFDKYGKNREKIRMIGLCGYVVGLLAKYMLQLFMYRHYGLDITVRFLWLQSIFTYITSCGIFCFFHSFERVPVATEESLPTCTAFGKGICLIGKYTFYIYLVHRMVIYKTYPLQQWVLAWSGNGQNMLKTTLYYLVYGMAVFGLSMAIAVLFKISYSGLRRLCLLFSGRLKMIERE